MKFGYRIAVLRNWYGGPAYRQLEMDNGITESEASVVFFLGRRDGSLAQDIADTIGRPKNSISRAVHLLLAKKMVRRVAGKVDRRQKQLYLTDSGWVAYQKIVPMFLARESQLVSTLSGPELAFLDAVLTKMVDHLPDWARGY
ncbi:MAG: MarR family winged helix-turn-helix transcriptional regulator [Parvibaculaceae bacterium]